MASIIVCDGGCGSQSPDPVSRLYVANKWLAVTATWEHHRHTAESKIFCPACAPRVLAAMEPTHQSGKADQ